MEMKIFPLYYGGRLMRWVKGAIAKGAKGFVWVAGTEGQNPTIDPEDPELQGQRVVGGPVEQTKMCFEKLKAALEEMGSSLDKIVMMN